MKQLDYETSNYKNKESVKLFVDSINDLTNKFVKTFDSREAELKKINATIDRKNDQIVKCENNVIDFTKKIDEFHALKEKSNAEIETLNMRKSEVSYTDSEVQKMEIDDINFQINAKKNIVGKISTKIESAKNKIKTNNEEKRNLTKEIKDLNKERDDAENTLRITNEMLELIGSLQSEMNTRMVEIINSVTPSKRKSVIEVSLEEVKEEEPEETTDDFNLDNIPVMEPPQLELASVLDEPIEDAHTETVIEIPEDLLYDDEPLEAAEVNPDEFLKQEEKEVVKEDKKEKSPLYDAFKEEGIDFETYKKKDRDKMIANEELVLKNLEILKRHEVPLEYTLDQAEILYNITSQDLDDLLSIITTDDEGNGMGFTIDFTFNILTELSKIDVDRLIDVYNSEFMNVNSKTGIMGLLKMTNPSIGDFAKNKRANIEVLKSLNVMTTEKISRKHPEFVEMDNPLFIEVVNSFDRDDLVEKLNNDVNVVPKIIEYWKNN